MISDVVENIRKSKKLDESFHSAGAHDEDAFESEEADEFQDAHDYFDPDMVDQVEKLKSLQVDELDDLELPKQEVKPKTKKPMTVSVCMPRFKISILEAQDLEKELLRDIKEKIGG